jgi:hypothetical protein
MSDKGNGYIFLIQKYNDFVEIDSKDAKFNETFADCRARKGHLTKAQYLDPDLREEKETMDDDDERKNNKSKDDDEDEQQQDDEIERHHDEQQRKDERQNEKLFLGNFYSPALEHIQTKLIFENNNILIYVLII